MRLHLVRHGLSKVDPTTPASTWPLDPAADAGIEELRGSGVLPTAAAWHSSAEPKALATAERLSPDRGCIAVTGLHEAGRPADWRGREEFTVWQCAVPIDLGSSSLVSVWGQWRDGRAEAT